MRAANDSEYGQLICQWFSTEYPDHRTMTSFNLLEILTNLIVSTKENRYGPIPAPENLVEIRKVIRGAIETGSRIPFLVAWGGRKSNPKDTVDLAEIFALTQLIKLDRTVKLYHPQGIMVNIRIEDTGALWLYRADHADQSIERYTRDMVTLTKILKEDSLIYPIPESSLMNLDEYMEKSKILSAMIYKYLVVRKAFPLADPSLMDEFKALNDVGWKGTIPAEQQEYYYSRYKHLYPGQDESVYVTMLADYLGGAKVRYDLGGRGEPTKDFIQLSFVPPVPGAPDSLTARNVYWRTIPTSQSRTHIAPWRAKGYFKINGDITGKIISYGDPLVSQLNQSSTFLSDGSREIEIDSNYLIE